MRRIAMGLVVTAVAAIAAPVSGQEPVDSRWLAWLGCWETPGEAGPMTCFLPSGDSDTVERVTIHNGDVRSEILHADGRARTISSEGCDGTHSLQFSDDERRVYATLSMQCEGGETRASRSLLAFVGPDAWIDVTAADVAGREVSWVTPYQPASPERVRDAGIADAAAGRQLAVQSARYAATGPLTVDAIIDAHAAVGSEAVRSWIGQQGQILELNADHLVRLADAGVAPEVIDVAVAVSFPEEFQVSRQPDESVADDRDRRRVAYGAFWPYYDRYGGWYSYNDPFYSQRFGSPYHRYNPYGWGGWTYGGPTVVIVRPVDEAPDRGGRVIKGRGYSSNSGGSGAARPRGNGDSGSSKATASSRASGSSSTGRKAKRRD